MKNVVWVDDDSATTLKSLAVVLKNFGLAISCFENYTSAMTSLRREASSTRFGDTRLLLDVVIPSGCEGELLDPLVGLALAEEACLLGVRKICFLTVMMHDETVQARINSMIEKNAGLKTLNVHKLELLEDGKIPEMVSFLKGDF
jgi:hypothetical protein